MNRLPLLLLLGSLPAAAAPPSASAPPVPSPSPATPVIARFASPSGAFIDDAFALRDDGKWIAYVTTDGAEANRVHLAEIGGPPAGEVRADVPGVVTALYWLGSDRVLAVVREGDKPSVIGLVISKKGMEKERIGPAGQLALGTYGGKPAIIAYTRNGVEHSLVALHIDSGKPLGKKVLREDKEGRIPHGSGSLKPLWWMDGFTTLASIKSGEYDKARDMRRPDRFARLEVFTGRIKDEREIEDVLGFAQVTLDRRGHENTAAFAHVSEDRRKLVLVDGIEEHELALGRPLWKYDLSTVADQPLDDHRSLLSVTVDPTNFEAVKRKKVDADEIDFYEVDRRSHATALKLRLDGQSRPNAWRSSGGRLALLRKNKGYDRGGVTIEVYELH